MMVEAINHNTVGPARRVDRRRVMAVLLVLLLVLSGVAFPPWVFVSYAAGFLKSHLLLLLFLVGGFALSGALLLTASLQFVRLRWDEGKGGAWGLVIGRSDMKTPPSEPGMYGERRTELRPGIYFWYREA